MPGVRDRNLRSGDLHEELGLLLLRTVALVASVPRQEDVGTDAFATLVRPDGSRRLLPDVSFLVQLKAASVKVVPYTRPDAVAWISNLEFPLFIGRVSLKQARIELFSTQRLHQILLETAWQKIYLLLDKGDESSRSPTIRRAMIGPPVHAWSLDDTAQPGFLTRSHDILRPHVESLRRNRLLREIGYQQMLRWETSQPPVDHGTMVMGSSNKVQDILREMVPHTQGLLLEMWGSKRYGDFPMLLAMVEMMRRRGVDPDPGNGLLRLIALQAEGPELSDEDVIRLRFAAGFGCLDLSRLQLREESLVAIPDDVENLVIIDVPISDSGVAHLQRLGSLSRLNLAGSIITDAGLDCLATLRNLRWLNVERTRVTDAGIDRLRASLPNLEIVH